MFNFFKRFKTVKEDTFKTRVDRFWEWFASRSDRMLSTIDDKRCGDLTNETSEHVNKLGPNFGWVFGPGGEGARHSFTLTGEGVIERQLLAQYWKSRAPALDGWTIYSSRQPSKGMPAWHVEMFGESFDPAGFWCSVLVNENDEKFDITAWHPKLLKLSETDRFKILFIVLDELFGEIGTGRWLGEIKITNSQLAESMPIAELRDFIEAEAKRRDWKILPPGEVVTLFTIKEPKAFPRGDTITWNSVVPDLVSEFFDSGGKPRNLVEGTGAEFLFVHLPREMLPKGKEIEARTEIEDAIHAALRAADSGCTVGSALGRSGGYVDVLAYDGGGSVEVVLDTMQKLGMPTGAALYRFVAPSSPISKIT